MNDPQRKLWVKVLFAAAGVCVLAASPCLLGSVLGYMGILADVGTQENQQIGSQALRMAAWPLGLGVLALVAALLLRSRKT